MTDCPYTLLAHSTLGITPRPVDFYFHLIHTYSLILCGDDKNFFFSLKLSFFQPSLGFLTSLAFTLSHKLPITVIVSILEYFQFSFFNSQQPFLDSKPLHSSSFHHRHRHWHHHHYYFYISFLFHPENGHIEKSTSPLRAWRPLGSWKKYSA